MRLYKSSRVSAVFVPDVRQDLLGLIRNVAGVKIFDSYSLVCASSNVTIRLDRAETRPYKPGLSSVPKGRVFGNF